MNNIVSDSVPPLRAKKKRMSNWMFLSLYTLMSLTIMLGLFLMWFYLTDSAKGLRYQMADTLITTQHRHWAKYLIGQQELDKRVQKYWDSFDQYAEVKEQENLVVIAASETPKPEAPVVKPKPLIEIEPIEGKGFKGQMLIVNDPKKLRIAVPGKVGKGEKVTSMVERLGAVAGVNAGGFVDPEWMGNGFQPTGVVMSGGKVFYNDGSETSLNHIVAIDKEGKLITGKYSVKDLKEMGVQEAVTFSPRFIVNGQGLIKSQADGWGIAPRTCIAQKADGTILFAIIDGRQPTHSIGATLYDVQEVFLKYGAVTAANLDGGSSTVLVQNDPADRALGLKSKILNKPASEYGERYLPSAWLVFEHPETADIRNIWEGLDISKIDPSKW